MAAFDRYKVNTTGLEIIAQVGGKFQPRFFCDHADSIYTTKAPVAKLKLTPTVQYINTNIAWDVSASVSATGTIDTFDLYFGGGGASDLTGQDWAVDPKTGNVQYTTVGQYEAYLYVTDTLGNRSAAAYRTVHIVDIPALVNRIYIATDDGGMYLYDSGGTPTQSNGSMTGSDILFASGKLNPHYSGLGVASQHYWAATGGGVAYSTDGGSTWSTISKATLGDPTNTAADVTPPDTDDLDSLSIDFDPQDKNRVYLLRATDSTWNASNSARVFLYWSDDYGTTWTSFGIGV